MTPRAASSYLARANDSYAKGEFRRAIEDYTTAIAGKIKARPGIAP